MHLEALSTKLYLSKEACDRTLWHHAMTPSSSDENVNGPSLYAPRGSRRRQVVELIGDEPTLRDPKYPPHNLPLELSSFIGRQREIEEITRLLAKTRLLTLTGPGGSGKTRLALKVAHDLMEEFEDGVRLVELASLS